MNNTSSVTVMKQKTILAMLMYFLLSVSVSQAYAQELAGTAVDDARTNVQQWQKPLKPGAWYQIKAGNFIIWYEEYDESVATELASYADKFNNQYKELFQYELNKVHIMVHGNMRVPNGSYSFYPSIINFYPTSAMVDSKGYNWNFYLLAHEFVHYMHLEYRRGLGGVLASIFGPAGRVVVMATPLWQIEGIATAIESDYTSSGRMQNPKVTMPLRADILLQNPKTYLDITLTHVEDEIPNAKRYSYGMELMTYIRSKYGYQTAIDIWKHFMKFPLNFSSRHKRFTGKTLYELYAEMLVAKEAELEKYKSWPRGQEISSKDNQRASYNIVSTSDDAALVLKKGYDIQTQYMLYNPEDDSLTKLFAVNNSGISFGSSFANANISKDGNYVVYQKSVSDINRLKIGSASAGVFNDLFLYNTQTKKHRRLTKKQSIVMPIISADNTYIYASQYTNRGNYSRIIRFSVDSPKDGFEIVYEGKESVIPAMAISPDGAQLAFVERSHLSGISLQILNLVTMSMRTLVHEDYWLWISNLEFIDTQTLSLSSDIEEVGVNAQLYSIDIASNTWTRQARDKVGFASAVKIKGKVLYVSHNSTANSMYVYSKDALTIQQQANSIGQIIDLASIQRPVYNSNALNDYLNQDSIQQFNARKSTGDESASTISKGAPTPITKKRRIYGFLPSRLLYVYPLWQISKYNNIGIITSFVGKTNLSSLTMGIFYQLETTQVLYSTNYTFIVNPLGAFTLKGLRDSGYQKTVDTNFITDEYSAGYARALYISTGGFNVSMMLKGLWQRVAYNVADEKIKSVMQVEDIDAEAQHLQFETALPLAWDSGKPRLISKRLAWNINPSVYYRPALLGLSNHEFQENIDAYIQVPIGRLLGAQLSTYNAFTNADNIDQLNVQRFARYAIQSPGLLPSTAGLLPVSGSTSQMYGGKGSIATAIQSSFALDFMINFGNHKKGAFFFHPYTSYINFFAEQTTGYNTVSNAIEVNEYLVTGTEIGLSIAFFSTPVNLKLGAAFKVPYADYVEFNYAIYLSIGPQLYDTPGHSKEADGIQ